MRIKQTETTKLLTLSSRELRSIHKQFLSFILFALISMSIETSAWPTLELSKLLINSPWEEIHVFMHNSFNVTNTDSFVVGGVIWEIIFVLFLVGCEHKSDSDLVSCKARLSAFLNQTFQQLQNTETSKIVDATLLEELCACVKYRAHLRNEINTFDPDMISKTMISTTNLTMGNKHTIPYLIFIIIMNKLQNYGVIGKSVLWGKTTSAKEALGGQSP